MYLLPSAPNEDSNQHAHQCSPFFVLLSACRNVLSYIWNVPSEDSDQTAHFDQTAQMRSLIWIFAGRTYPNIRFLTLRFHIIWKYRCYSHLTNWHFEVDGTRSLTWNATPYFKGTYFWGGCQTATRFSMPHFDNPFSCYYQPNNYLTNSSLLTLITLISVFKHISLMHSCAYKWQINK